MSDYSLLSIDIGNTNAKIALFMGETLKHLEILSSSNYESLLKLFEEDKFKDLRGVIVSNVAAGDEKTLFSRLTKQIPSVIFLNHQTPLPISISYETPQTLGTDRIAAACAAWYKSNKNPSLAITCGTCVIYDFIDASGNYHGGAISPGLWQRLRALHEFSARLPLVKPLKNSVFPGRNTDQSILAGVLKGMAFEIDGFINELRQSEPNLHVYLSGGDAHYFATQLKNSIFAAPNLIMEGLNQILLFNVKNR
ncbi:MAG: type pantothenate kinase [Bacteroidales bacterium]|jgi:type III pantothenate kinase|nr:type pantothenate kinase [Bacteroidales bacterium]MDN5328362.1 type pantothenate kinase [Bacteroidales bacterium]